MIQAQAGDQSGRDRALMRIRQCAQWSAPLISPALHPARSALSIFGLLLAGCGGGGSASAPAAGGGAPPAPVAMAAVSGTAATGAPLAGAQISMKCAGTPGTDYLATAQANGLYRIESVPVSAAPCLLRAQLGASNYVSPLASLSPGTVTANITPLTHLLASRVLGQAADLAFETADAASLSRLSAQSLSAAKGDVSAQLDRLGIASAALSPDWIGTPFAAASTDAMDQTLEQLAGALLANQLSLASAASQLAAVDAVLSLAPGQAPVQPSCAPSLSSGFAGVDKHRWIAASEASPLGAAGVGIGGGPGLLRGASVELTFHNGERLLGAVTDAAAGMVTLVPCELINQVPVLVRISGAASSGATYYDAGLGDWASFEGASLHGLIQRFEQDKNIAVTPLTEAAYQRVLALATETATAGGLRLKAVAEPWHDPARLQLAHDEVLAAFNDQLPGIYQLSQIDRLPVSLDADADSEGSEALPHTESGIYGAVLAALARAAAASLPEDATPALAISRRIAADLADGLLDNPLAGLNLLPQTAVLPAYEVDQLWQGLTTGTMHIGRKAGVSAFQTDKPFPLALVHPSGFRNSDAFSQQYTGLFSDGILRVIAEVYDSDADANRCGNWCNPVRTVRATDTTQWWVFELGALADFDPDSRIGRLPGGQTVRVNSLHSSSTPAQLLTVLPIQPVSLFPNVRSDFGGDFIFRARDGGIYRYFPASYVGAADYLFAYPQASGLRSLAGMRYSIESAFVDITLDAGGLYDGTAQRDQMHLFGIDADGDVQRLVYEIQPFASPGGWPPDVFVSATPMVLPDRVRQLSSDGRLVYALLVSGEVYLLNPEILVTEAGSYPVPGINDSTARYFYQGRYLSAGLTAGVPIRVDGASNICRIGGTFMLGCDGQLQRIERAYYWSVTGISQGSVRAPDAAYTVVPDTRFDASGWRALKAPLSVDIAWDDSYLRLLAAKDGRYVLQSDTFAVSSGIGAGAGPRADELDQAVIESWFADTVPTTNN